MPSQNDLEANRASTRSQQNQQRLNESIPLRDYVETVMRDAEQRCEDRLNAREQLMQERFTTNKAALDATIRSLESYMARADAVSDKRYDLIQELRRQVSEQTNQFITRNELNNVLEPVKKNVDDLRTYRDSALGKSSGMGVGWQVFITVLTVVVSVSSALYTVMHNFK